MWSEKAKLAGHLDRPLGRQTSFAVIHTFDGAKYYVIVAKS